MNKDFTNTVEEFRKIIKEKHNNKAIIKSIEIEYSIPLEEGSTMYDIATVSFEFPRILF